MKKWELLKQLEDVNDEDEVLVNVKNLNDGEAKWHDISAVSTNEPATLLVSETPVME